MIKACFRCMEACNISFHACKKAEANLAGCMDLQRECADICNLAIQSMQRSSPFVGEICGLCAQICEACAIECKKHGYQHCRDCAQACDECVEIWRKVAVKMICK
nr:four-helix bundle copper-binding protein [Oikeobacillus pervagus]